MAAQSRWSRREVLAWSAVALGASARAHGRSQTPLDQLAAEPAGAQDDGGCRHLVGMRLPDLDAALDP